MQNYPFFRYKLFVETFNTQLNKTTNLNSLKSQKLLGQQIRKRCCKTLAISVVKSILSLVVVEFNCHCSILVLDWKGTADCSLQKFFFSLTLPHALTVG